MKIKNAIGFLVIFSALAFGQVNSSSDTINKNVIVKKVVVVTEKPKKLTKIQPIPKTTWSKIKDLFM